MSSAAIGSTRYERIMEAHTADRDSLAAAMAEASRRARASVAVTEAREAAIRDVAAGVAGPALVGYALWLLERAAERSLQRLRFLSRDAQVMYELARRLAPALGCDLDLEYVYSSRRTWSFAASDAAHLSRSEWLFNSFMRSNAADICARLGLAPAEYQPLLIRAGVSLDPDVRADDATQFAALRRFADQPEVARAIAPQIGLMRQLVLDYAAQHQLASASTALVDMGWTGRMVGSLDRLLLEAGAERPQILLWGHEPRTTGWTDPDRVTAYVYNTASGLGARWRVPDAPFLVETLGMSDHGIVAGYRRRRDGRVEAVLQSDTNPDAEHWGLRLYRSTLYEFCASLDLGRRGPDKLRPVIHDLMQAFWCHPTRMEARAWGSYIYDSDPTGTAARPLGRPFHVSDLSRALRRRRLDRGDRAWLWGSIAMSAPPARLVYAATTRRRHVVGAPASD